MLTLRISNVELVADQIRRFELREVDDRPLPHFTAGAHISLEVQTLRGGESRNYSLINNANQCGHYEIAVLRCAAGGGGSIYMCDQLQQGDRLRSSLPKNDFSLHEEATEQVLIAGGIGITPILSMAETLASRAKPFEFHYSARRPNQMAFLDRVVEVSGGRAQLYFDDGDPAKGVDLAGALGDSAPGRHAYVCGPRGMIDATVATARKLKWSPANLHFESFAAPTSQDGDRPIEVFAKSSGQVVQVPPGKSILECLIDAGLDPMFDCKRGECGACLTTVLDGVPDHRDYVLDEAARSAGTSMCICVSRAKSEKLVLEI